MSIKGKKEKANGFTLIELLISIAVFSIILVVMTGIILNIASVSYTVDRRTDFINILDNVVNNIKNEMRSASSMGLCGGHSSQKSIFITRKIFQQQNQNQSESYQLAVYGNRLVWNKLQGTSPTCQLVEPLVQEPITPPNMYIQNLRVKSASTGDGKNTLLFILFEACESPSINKRIFNCHQTPTENLLNPYRYMFAITTKNI